MNSVKLTGADKGWQIIRLVNACILILVTAAADAAVTRHELVIDRQMVNITGKPDRKLVINGSLPGPVLRFTEGDEAEIVVSNRLDETSSLHWHGLLLPDAMDGVPGFAGFEGIAPGATHTYRFSIRQSGTYWYHAHSRGQEQDGLYGAIVIDPKQAGPDRYDREYVVVLSDYHREDADTILANLKKSSEYYQNRRRTLFDFLRDAGRQGFGQTWDNTLAWGQMRMLPTDLSDVSGYTFLINGKTPEQNWTALFAPGERLLLRFINASAMSFYDVRIPGLPMSVVAADGQPVEPVQVDEFRFGVAETYDVVVEPAADRVYSIEAESIDRTGFALGSISTRAGMRGPVPEPRGRALLTMADMGHTAADPTGADDTDHSAHAAHTGHDEEDFATGKPGSGWAESGAPTGSTVLAYTDLRYRQTQADQRPPEREIEIRLGGNMERYVWTLNGRKYSEHPEPITVRYGERVRLRFVNETMMAHPMHLHGMFVQLENGQPLGKLPNKHTVIIAPGDTYSALLTADEPGEWAIHCHLMFHSMAGMMGKLVVAVTDMPTIPALPDPPATPAGQGDQHVH